MDPNDIGHRQGEVNTDHANDLEEKSLPGLPVIEQKPSWSNLIELEKREDE